MTGKEFLNHIVNGEVDLVDLLLQMLGATGSTYCVIGGLAVNAYAEPVVSLDLDMVVVSDHLEALSEAARAAGLKVQVFPHSVNLSHEGSDLRVQLQTDPRYQGFIARAEEREVLGYTMRVACIEDVLTGKMWAYADPTRRRSKRQKDLADIMRLVETHPGLVSLVPPGVKELLEE